MMRWASSRTTIARTATQPSVCSGDTVGDSSPGVTATARAMWVAVGGFPGLLTGSTELLRQGTACFGYGLSLAAPIILAALIGNVGLAVMNRAAPAVNVFSIALSAVLLVGIALLIASAGGFVAGAVDVAHAAVTSLNP